MKNIGSVIWNFIDKAAYFVFSKVLRMFGKEISGKQWDSFMQFVKFGFVGLSNTVISYVVYAGLVYLGMHYLISSIISFIVSVLNSFYWNNKYVFSVNDNEKRSWLKSLFKTFAAYSFTGLGLNNILLVIWVDEVHVSEYIAPIINLIITIPVNYIMNKFWAFKKYDEKS